MPKLNKTIEWKHLLFLSQVQKYTEHVLTLLTDLKSLLVSPSISLGSWGLPTLILFKNSIHWVYCPQVCGLFFFLFGFAINYHFSALLLASVPQLLALFKLNFAYCNGSQVNEVIGIAAKVQVSSPWVGVMDHPLGKCIWALGNATAVCLFGFPLHSISETAWLRWLEKIRLLVKRTVTG